jgi:fucose permease
MMVNLYLASLSLNTSNLVITIFITATARVGIVVISFAVVLRIFKGDRPEYWVQLIGFVFGVGAMCGPFIVTIFRLETFKALGFANIVTLAILISNPLPNLEENTEKKEKKGPSLSNKSVIWACLIFFFYSTLELGMGSWISTYAIKAGVATV